MNIEDKIKELIEDEVERRVNERITQFSETISKKYQIPLKSLLCESKIEVTKTSICLGTNKNGKRCMIAGKYNGYCKRHMDQYKPIKRIVSSDNIVKHTHTIPFPLFKKGCPACERVTENKILIDI